MKTLDVCGISCPEPLIRLKEALKTEKNIVVITDSRNALENCTEYAKAQGCCTEIEQDGNTYKIRVTKA